MRKVAWIVVALAACDSTAGKEPRMPVAALKNTTPASPTATVQTATFALG